MPGGPYRVYGLALVEMAPVLTWNGEPVEWHTLRRIDGPDETYDICRCGRSQARPYCDRACESSAWDHAESADRRPYREQAVRTHRGPEALADTVTLCAGAGFCKTRTLRVWDLFLQAQDPAIREQVRDMVWHCPSGRLALYDAEGFPNEPDLPQEVAVIPGGPLWVRGGVPVIGEDGRPWEPRNRVTLCRCGASKNKPFCDESHENLHFDER